MTAVSFGEENIETRKYRHSFSIDYAIHDDSFVVIHEFHRGFRVASSRAEIGKVFRVQLGLQFATDTNFCPTGGLPGDTLASGETSLNFTGLPLTSGTLPADQPAGFPIRVFTRVSYYPLEMERGREALICRERSDQSTRALQRYLVNFSPGVIPTDLQERIQCSRTRKDREFGKGEESVVCKGASVRSSFVHGRPDNNIFCCSRHRRFQRIKWSEK